MDPSSVILTGGAAGVAIWILKLLVDGKLHTDAEIKIRDDRIGDLLKQNETLTSALKASNESSATIIRLYRGSPEEA